MCTIRSEIKKFQDHFATGVSRYLTLSIRVHSTVSNIKIVIAMYTNVRNVQLTISLNKSWRNFMFFSTIIQSSPDIRV